jgi:hypothetical protein
LFSFVLIGSVAWLLRLLNHAEDVESDRDRLPDMELRAGVDENRCGCHQTEPDQRDLGQPIAPFLGEAAVRTQFRLVGDH